MSEELFYIVVALVVVTEAVVAAILNAQRKKLDLSKPEDAAKDKGLRAIVTIVCVQAVVIPAILLFVVKPMLVA